MKIVIDTTGKANLVLVTGSDGHEAHANDANVTRQSRSIGSLVKNTLDRASINIADVRQIAVNIGPGGLNSTRAGIAFAKGLAYSSSSELITFNSLEVLAFLAPQTKNSETISIARGYGGGSFVGRFSYDNLVALKHGNAREIIKQILAATSNNLVLTGNSSELCDISPQRISHSNVVSHSVFDIRDYLNQTNPQVAEYPYAFSPLYTYCN